MNILKQQISQIIKDTIFQTYNITFDDIKLDIPPKKDLGEFCFGPFLLAKPLGKNPAQISNELLIALKGNPFFKELSVAGPYLNMKLSGDFYANIFSQFSFYQYPQKEETIIVDYIGANMGKPLHIGHMCTPNQGQITINLFRHFGYKVIGDSHFGDWGIIFGKLLLAYKMFGDKQKLEENALEHLYELYIQITQEVEENPDLEQEIRKEFQHLSSGDKQSIKMWEYFTKSSIASAQKGLDRLGVKPDYNIGESFYEGLNLPKLEEYPDLKYSMKDIISELLEKNIATKNEDNSVGVIFDEESKIPSVMVQKRDGTHGYLASDLAAIKYRKESFSPSKIIYHVDNRQSLHFTQAFAIAKSAGWSENMDLIFAGNGFISLPSGAMSSRKGNIIRLEDLLDEGITRAQHILQEKGNVTNSQEQAIIAEILGIGSIKYNYLSKSRSSDVIFNWDDALSFEGNSFPYIAYSYVRGKNILKNSLYHINDIEKFDDFIFEHEEQFHLIKELFALDEVLEKSIESLEYHHIIAYIYSLAKLFSSFYNNISILGEENEQKKLSNLSLILRYGETLELIFGILSIKLPSKM